MLKSISENLQVRGTLVVVANITFNLNIGFRFNRQFKVINYVSTGETYNLPLKRKSIWLETARCENSCKPRLLQVEPFKLNQNSDFVSDSNLSNICSSPETVFGRFNYLKKKQIRHICTEMY